MKLSQKVLARFGGRVSVDTVLKDTAGDLRALVNAKRDLIASLDSKINAIVAMMDRTIAELDAVEKERDHLAEVVLMLEQAEARFSNPKSDVTG